MDEMEDLNHRREDDLRAYPIPEPGEIWLRGKGVLDGAVLAPGAKAPKQRATPATRPWWRRLLGAG
jgi:hypothetical protein